MKFIKVLVLIFVTLLYCNIAKSDNIRDFEIEEMSIGDSLLDYFSNSEIIQNNLEYYKDKRFITIGFENHPMIKNYDWIEISYKQADKSFSIASLNGVLAYDREYNKCLKKKKKINKEFKSLFTIKPETYSGKHPVDKSGKSNFENTEFYLNDGIVVTTCIDWSKKMEKKYFDHLKVFISTIEFWKWINSNPY